MCMRRCMLLLLVLRQLQDLVLEALLLLRDLGLPELFLIVPALLEKFKLVDAHMHQDFDAVLALKKKRERLK